MHYSRGIVGRTYLLPLEPSVLLQSSRLLGSRATSREQYKWPPVEKKKYRPQGNQNDRHLAANIIPFATRGVLPLRRTKLLRSSWKFNHGLDNQQVDVHFSRLREK